MKIIKQGTLVCLLALNSNLVLAAEDCTLNGVEVSDSNGATTAGKTGIMRCKDRDTGKMLKEREIRAGKWVGVTRNYVDGVLSLEYTQDENGREHGVRRAYGPNKQLLLEENNEHGTRVGVMREWYADGKLRSIENYAKTESEKAKARFTPKGQLNSLECASKPVFGNYLDDAGLCGFKGKPSTIEYFHDDGKVRARETYLAGMTQSYLELYANTGKTKLSYTLQGKRGNETQFNQDGVKLREVLWDEAEKPRVMLRKAEFHASGSLVAEQQFGMFDFAGKRRHLLTLDATYFLNGQPRTRESFSIQGQERVKEVQMFHDNGKLYSQGRYVEEGQYRQRALGVHQSFSTNGTLISESHYDEKGKITRERQFDEAGKLKSDDAVFEDGSRKAFAK